MPPKTEERTNQEVLKILGLGMICLVVYPGKWYRDGQKEQNGNV